MTFFSFYLLGVLIVFCLQIHFLPYEDEACFGVSKTEYVIKTLMVSFVSWVAFLMLILVLLEGKRE